MFGMPGRESGLANGRMVDSLMEEGILKTGSIIRAFRRVKRADFVLPEHRSYAYHDSVLPTVGDSTISAPHAVAAMLEELAPRTGEKILEIGTGSGYNACLLSACVGPKGKVISVEIDEKVAEFARRNVERLKPKNVTLVEGDGSGGYQKLAPYNRMIYTCAIPKIPKAAILQLKVGGKLVAPVGGHPQVLTSIKRVSQSETAKRELGYYLFVPLKKARQWARGESNS